MSNHGARRRIGTFTLGAAAGATAATLVVVGLGSASPGLGSSGLASMLGRLLTPPAAAGELPAFADCEDLRQWYVDAALPRVGPWGFDSPVMYETFGARSDFGVDAAGAAESAVSNSDTGTNVQEGGVDEPDLAKTDGALLVRLVGRDLVVADVTGVEPRTLSRTQLPGDPGLSELLFVDDTVLVVGTDYGYGGPGPIADSSLRVAPGWGGSARTHLIKVDVSVPAAPRVESHQQVDGDLVAAREYGDGLVRVVVSTGLPPLDFVQPNRTRTPGQSRLANREIVRDAPIEAWLPGIEQAGGLDRKPLVDCADVRHPEKPAGMGTLSVLTLDVDDPLALTTTAVTAAGELVYSSTDRLYVATISGGWWDDVVPLAGNLAGDLPSDITGDVAPDASTVDEAPATQVHAFALDAGATTYVASGTVPGTVRDRWSFDEHEGMLRVATAIGPGWSPRENSVQVLEERGSRLEVVGSVAGLGPDEQIQSVRWLDDLAVVVTFRQTDPLYTVDLTDPTQPRVLGELKIPGFSAYLHPVGDDLLLGLGQDAALTGETRGAQAAVFDLADLADVRRTSVHDFGETTETGTRADPRAFTYLADREVALVPVEDWRDGLVRLVAVGVGRDGSLTVESSWDLGRWNAASVRALPLDDGRVAVVHDEVRILDVR